MITHDSRHAEREIEHIVVSIENEGCRVFSVENKGCRVFSIENEEEKVLNVLNSLKNKLKLRTQVFKLLRLDGVGRMSCVQIGYFTSTAFCASYASRCIEHKK